MCRFFGEKNKKNEIFAFQRGGNEADISEWGGGEDGFFQILIKSHTLNDTRMTIISL